MNTTAVTRTCLLPARASSRCRPSASTRPARSWPRCSRRPRANESRAAPDAPRPPASRSVLGCPLGPVLGPVLRLSAEDPDGANPAGRRGIAAGLAAPIRGERQLEGDAAPEALHRSGCREARRPPRRARPQDRPSTASRTTSSRRTSSTLLHRHEACATARHATPPARAGSLAPARAHRQAACPTSGLPRVDVRAVPVAEPVGEPLKDP
jgi:hypothetical protein